MSTQTPAVTVTPSSHGSYDIRVNGDFVAFTARAKGGHTLIVLSAQFGPFKAVAETLDALPNANTGDKALTLAEVRNRAAILAGLYLAVKATEPAVEAAV